MKIEFSPDLILYNGKIVTVDSHFSIVEAVAVYDGKFVATGNSADIEVLAGNHTKKSEFTWPLRHPGPDG